VGNQQSIEKFTTNGTPSVFVSITNGGFGGGLAFDKAGYLYAEASGQGAAPYKIEKIAPNGALTTFATDPGNGSVLNLPYGMAFDSAGNLYVVNSGNSTIEKFTTNGTPSLFASNGLFEASFIAIQPGLSVSALPPTLSIIYSGNQAVVSWPSSVTGWTLQTNNNLSTSAWGNYLGTIVNNSVTNSPPKGNVFFRLANP
jgi:hypothetical protein